MVEELSKYKIASFDVFDTSVTRITADPKGVFQIVGENIGRTIEDIPGELANNFLDIRVAAERKARKQHSSEDISIYQIYNLIGQKYSLQEGTVKSLIQAEIEEETKSIRVVKATYQMIDQLRAAGCNIIFISDMYLPVEVLKRILEHHGLFKGGDRLYLSNEHGLSKKTGNLYREVIAAESCAPSEIVHVGDNYRSDHLMAGRSVKIQSRYTRICHLTRYETILKKSSRCEFDISSQLLAGASRLARLEVNDDLNVRERALHGIGANVLAPILVLFINWLLNKASINGLKRLYFLSRDGEVMLEVAKRLARLKDCNIELKYLYVSRQALLAPSFVEFNEMEIGWVTQKDPVLSIDLVAKRLSVEPRELYDSLIASGYPAIDPNQDLNDKQIIDLRIILFESKSVRELVFSKISLLRKHVLGYLKQEGLLDAGAWAVVDCGWNGRLQHAIQNILSRGGWDGETKGYYFGLLDKYNLEGNKEGFLFSPGNTAYSVWCRPFTFIVEMLTSAKHGVVQSYALNTAGKYQPVLSENTNTGSFTDDITALRFGVEDFLGKIAECRFDFNETESREKAFKILKELYLSPSTEEASALGGMVFSHDQTDQYKYLFAPPMNLKDVFRYARNFLNNKKYAQTFWLHGSRVQSKIIPRTILSLFGFLYYVLNSVYVKYKYLD